MRARLPIDAAVPAVGDEVRLVVLGDHTCFYAADETLIAMEATT